MIPFWKLHGIGNDFVFVRPSDLPACPEPLVHLMCDRTHGIGSDGLIAVESTGPQTATMRMWNPDGSESSMCGNGLRCSALWLNRTSGTDSDWSIRLGGSDSLIEKVRQGFSVQMGLA